MNKVLDNNLGELGGELCVLAVNKSCNRKGRQECAKDAINRYNFVFLHEILGELGDNTLRLSGKKGTPS